MGKNNRRRSNKDDSGKGDDNTTASAGSSAARASPSTLPSIPVEESRSVKISRTRTRKTFYQWCLQEKQGVVWVLGCMLLGITPRVNDCEPNFHFFFSSLTFVSRKNPQRFILLSIVAISEILHGGFTKFTFLSFAEFLLPTHD